MTSKINIYSYLSYFMLAIFIFFILFFPSIANAATLTPRSALDSFNTNNKFDFTGIVDSDERPQENWTFIGNIGQYYGRKLYGLNAYFNYSLTKNHTYKFSISTSNNLNFSNFGLGNAYFCFGSSYSGSTSNCVTYNGIYTATNTEYAYSFTAPVSSNYFNFYIGPNANSNDSLTKTFAFKINSFSITDMTSIPADATNNDVISNQNSNTNSIITNDNRNTTNILGSITENSQNEININNQNFHETNQNINTAKQDIINNNNLNSIDTARNNFNSTLNNCGMLYKYFTLKGKGFYSNGSLFSDETMFYTNDYINLNGATKIVLDGFSGVTSGNIIIYDSNKNYLDYWGVRNQTINLPSDSAYFRIATSIPSGRIFKDKGCTNKLNDIDDYLKDDTDPNSNEIVDALDDIGVGTGPISSLVTLPITLLDKFEDGISSTCTAFNLGNLLGTNLTLPCIDIPSLIGNNLWTIIDAITSIFMIYNIVMLIITAFDHLTSLSDDFDTLYTPDSVYESRLVKKRGYERHGD